MLIEVDARMPLSSTEMRKRGTILIVMLRDASAAGLLLMSIVPGVLSVRFFGALLALWIVFAFLANQQAFARAYIIPSVRSYSVYLWALTYAAFYFTGHMHGAGIDRLLNYVGVGFFINFLSYYLENRGLFAVRLLTMFALSVILFVSFTTLRALALDPWAARLLSTGIPELTMGLTDRGIGSFGFIYGLLFVVVAILGSMRVGILAKHRLAAAALVSIFAYTIYAAAFTIALLLLAIAVTMLCLKIRNALQLAIATTSILVLILLLSPVVSASLFLLGDSVQHEALSVRLHDLAIISRDLSLEGTVSVEGRSHLFAISAHTFFSAPILGVGGRYGVYNTFEVIGAHATFLDQLASYGMLGAGVMFIGIYSNMRHVYRLLASCTQKTTYFSIMIAFFSLGWLNSMLTAPLISMVFFVAPGIIYSLGTDTREHFVQTWK